MQRFGLSLLCACLLLGGCASWRDSVAPQPADAASREVRRSEVIQSFEEQRDRAQLAAAMDRWEQGDIAGCESRVRGMLARRPKDVDAHVLLAELAFSCHNSTEAEAEYRAALELAPQRADVHHALALVLDATGRGHEAGVHFARAAEIDPANDLFRLR